MRTVMTKPEAAGARDEGPETADVETSSEDYARRFASAAGQWMLGVQGRIIRDWLPPSPPLSILDVGGGHGQLAPPLAAAGHAVTVLGSAGVCERRIHNEVTAGQVSFVTGSVTALPFPDRAFDVAVSIRLLPHCRQWPRLVGELCRVARATVIVDYPAARSLNCLTPALFGAKRRLEGNTRPYTLFAHRAVAEAFTRQGFVLRERRAQFFLPMVLHRLLNRPGWSASLEAACRALGLTALWGSPVLLNMRRGEGS